MCLIINAYINKEILQINNYFISHRTREEHVKPKVFRGKKIKKIREEIHKIEKREKKKEISKNKSWFWKRYMQLRNTQLEQPGDKKKTHKNKIRNKRGATTIHKIEK